MLGRWINHRTFYRFGAISLFVGIFSFLVFVVVFANLRKSGSTGIDASQIMKMRYDSQQEMIAEARRAKSEGS